MVLKDILPGRLGFGAAPLGNMFRDIPEKEALATVSAAWDDGIRYFDNAPFYGAGLAEIRMGAALAGRPRGDYVISTKVGRVILDEIEDVSARDLGEKSDVFKHGRPNKIINDYSEDGTLRSIEDSLKRLGTDHIDIAFVHDVAQDFYGDEWLAVFESARKGAFKALDRLRDERVVKAWGLGVNRVEPIELLLALEGPRPDGFLLAGRYTLLDHARALQLVSMRYENMKLVFCEQREQGTIQIWREPFVCLRAPKMYNLRMDPYERADITSNTYNDWVFKLSFLAVPAQALVAQFIGTFKEFPPRQTPSSFSVDQIMETLKRPQNG